MTEGTWQKGIILFLFLLLSILPFETPSIEDVLHSMFLIAAAILYFMPEKR